MKTTEIAELLTEADLFRLLPNEAILRLAGGAGVRELGRNDILFRQGDEAERMYVVAHGRVAIATKAEDGRESVVALMERGDLFGEMSLFDGAGRSAEARALEPTEVVEVPFDDVRAILEPDSRLLWGVIRLLVLRLRATDSALSDAVFLDVPGRTAKRLLELAGDRDEFVIPVTQEELAAMVGASRERVNKAIATFVRLGWVEQSDRQYRIVARDELTRRAH